MPPPDRVTKHFPFIFSAIYFLSTLDFSVEFTTIQKSGRLMYFMCFCPPPEDSVRQNILTWVSFLILLSWWKINSLTSFLYNTTSPRIYKVKIHAGKYPVLFPLLVWTPDDIDLHTWIFIFSLSTQIINPYCSDINFLILHFNCLNLVS